MPVTGSAELRHVAALLRKAHAVDLEKELKASQRAAVRPLSREIKAEAALLLPKRGGYAGTMSRAIRVTTSVGLGRGTLTARIFARGKKELRDVAAVNAGRIRHPLFGQRSHWYVTSAVPGFVDRPVARLIDRVRDEALDGVDRVLQKIARG